MERMLGKRRLGEAARRGKAGRKGRQAAETNLRDLVCRSLGCRKQQQEGVNAVLNALLLPKPVMSDEEGELKASESCLGVESIRERKVTTCEQAESSRHCAAETFGCWLEAPSRACLPALPPFLVRLRHCFLFVSIRHIVYITLNCSVLRLLFITSSEHLCKGL